jgi:hypothetical protein
MSAQWFHAVETGRAWTPARRRSRAMLHWYAVETRWGTRPMRHDHEHGEDKEKS